jgi:peptidoglycan/xylan/chitin deacetylase (PgdA/CDA1 family)
VTVGTSSPPADAPARPPPAPRPQLDGRTFPDKVVALTWDDGPDDGTLALARYLRAQHVPATFFVVGGWIPGLSDEPGQGAHVLATGYEHLHVLGDLVALGHRLGNHTRNHVILSEAPAGTAASQLREDQAAIDPYQKGATAFFRAPGGAWSASASAVVAGDPALARLVGPVRWDVDRKDWEGSLFCRSDRPAQECEPSAPGGASRVKPAVTAQRYLAAISEAGHGIVLLHDRVGHVGSDYALRVAQGLIPGLSAAGFVFAAPVLRFSPLAARGAALVAPGFEGNRGALPPELASAEGLVSGDVDGDGRPDACAPTGEGIVCALADGARYGHVQKWSAGADFGAAGGWGDAAYRASIRLGDLNGDGRADVCGRGRDGVVCALSSGRAFLGATLWLDGMSDAAGWRPHGASLTLGDVNGDGRADVCGDGPAGLVCALAP